MHLNLVLTLKYLNLSIHVYPLMKMYIVIFSDVHGNFPLSEYAEMVRKGTG